MVLSDISIKRPVFATVLSLLLVVLGLASFLRLPIREYPAIDPPVVSITTTYRGASAPVIESQVTEIIESAVAGIEGIKTISSASRDERSQVTIEFRLTRAIDEAANDVRDRVARALSRLPVGIDQPVIAKVDADARAILWVMLTSDNKTSMELTEVARNLFQDRLAIVDGVASVTINGERKPSMRIWLDRKALGARNLTVDDIENAIRRENVELPGGRIESTAREFSVRTDTRMNTPGQFASIVVSRREGAQVLLGEVARVEIAAEDDRGEMRINGRSAVGLGILRQSTANTLSVADGVKAEVERLRPAVPPGIDMIVGYDESLFISQSIYEVEHALMLALSLVIGVIYLFLGSFRATLIPAVAIPVSVIASFVALAALGFSLNVLTLLGLVLAIGLVVDDAIVVLENIHRRIEEGEPPLLAAYRGARQIAFAVVSTTLVLISVFVPISFMEGNVGRLFTEFGLALASSVFFSALVALTLTPMMCSKMLRSHEHAGLVARITAPVFNGMNAGFRWSLRRCLKVPVLVLFGTGVLSALAVVLFAALPKELVPTEDRGAIAIPTTGPEGASYAYMREHVIQIERILQPYFDRGEANALFAIVGGFQRPPQANQASVFLRLAPWGQRTRKQQQIVSEIFPQLSVLPGVRSFATNPGSFGQRGFQAPVQFVIGGPDFDTLAEWRDRMLERARQNPQLLNVDSNYKETKPEFRVQIDRRRAADLGVSVQQIGRTIETMLGAREVGSYVERGEEYKVILQARIEDRVTPSDLSNIFVRSTTTQQLVPLSNLISIEERARPQSLFREDRLRSIIVQASLAPGYTLGEALTFMDELAKEVLPIDARITYRGQSLEFKQSSTQLYITFGLALLIVFLVLAAQFESFIHPFVIMLSVPLAVTGGLFALFVQGLTLNIFSQIGMILLIGLMTKNGILVVEFANQLRDEGRSVYDAVVEASVVRLRPILMTSIATIFGAVPLAFASGAGAESREALGVVIMGGMMLSTVVTLYAVPALYLLLAPFTRPINAIALRLAGMDHASRTQPAGPAGAAPTEDAPEQPLPKPAE